MMKLLTRVKKLLNTIYPGILVLTGSAIFMVGITAVVVITKFASFSLPGMYHLAVLPIFITSVWWCFYFIYKGIKLLENKPQVNKKIREVNNGKQDRKESSLG